MTDVRQETTERVLEYEATRRRRTDNPRLLLTNDDGIESPGLRMLADRLARRHDIVVAAPQRDMSGSGTGIGRLDPKEGVGLEQAELGDFEAYAIAGPPGLAVMSGALGAFGRKPDLVISGINAGANTGHSVIHSGTVGAALTARTFGAQGVALSLCRSDPWHWETAVRVAERIVEWVIERDEPREVLNVNIPAVPFDQIAGIVWAPLDSFGHFRVASTEEGAGRVVFEVAGAHSGEQRTTDTALSQAGYVTLTPLATVETAAFPDVPDGELEALIRS